MATQVAKPVSATKLLVGPGRDAEAVGNRETCTQQRGELGSLPTHQFLCAVRRFDERNYPGLLGTHCRTSWKRLTWK